MIPSDKTLKAINEITGKEFSSRELFRRLRDGDCVAWGDSFMQMDTTISEDNLYLFINGICYGTIYPVTQEGVESALIDGVSMMLQEDGYTDDQLYNFSWSFQV